ncbi:MAG: hypothetical protein ACLR78_05335 [Roseburia sp.]
MRLSKEGFPACGYVKSDVERGCGQCIPVKRNMFRVTAVSMRILVRLGVTREDIVSLRPR